MSIEPVIVMRGATVGYGERPALREVDFRLDRGEVVALVGPNGSGKTTLVRGALGLARVMAGEVELFGTPAARFDERYRIGYVPQRHTVGGAVPSTVEEVVSSGRLPRKGWLSRSTREDRRAVADAIETVGLADRRRTTVATLSGGLQRRVLIARALAAQPEVLVMDEPTAGVDAASQENLVHTLANLVDVGLTLLVVTHEARPLLSILTRAVVLRDGHLVRDVPLRTGHNALDVGAAGLLDPLLDGHGDAGHDLGHSALGLHGGTGDPVRSPEPGWLGDPGLKDG